LAAPAAPVAVGDVAAPAVGAVDEVAFGGVGAGFSAGVAAPAGVGLAPTFVAASALRFVIDFVIGTTPWPSDS
jgi:hypothetical protein